MNDENQTATSFDSQRLSIRAMTEEGIKPIVVRFPTDEEWIEWGRTHKTTYRNLGRGIQEPVKQEPDESDAELVKSLRVDDDQTEIDQYEAFRILELLSRTQMNEDETVLEESIFRVLVGVAGDILTTHIFRMPTAKERFQFGKFATWKNAGNREIWSYNYGIVTDLYDKICQKSIGFSGPVSVIHKLPALQGLFSALEKLLGGAAPVNPPIPNGLKNQISDS